jgi:hypothetical protein
VLHLTPGLVEQLRRGRQSLSLGERQGAADESLREPRGGEGGLDRVSKEVEHQPSSEK